MSPTTPRVVVTGSFGYGNAGDEAVPLAVRSMLRSLGRDDHVDVLSRFAGLPDESVVGLGEDEAERRHWPGATFVVSGGGVIEPNRSCVMARTRETRRQGTTALLGVSVEPGVSFDLRSRKRLWSWLRGVDVVCTRDVLSERTLRRVLPTQRVRTVGDPVLWLDPASPASVASLVPPEPYVACLLAPRWHDDPAFAEWMAEELVALARERECGVLFVPMSALYDDDRVEHRRVAARMAERAPDVRVDHVDQHLAPDQVLALVAGARCAVAMRLHAAVMAWSSGVPFAAVSYHPKLAGFCETVGATGAVLGPRGRHRQTSEYGHGFADLAAEPGTVSRVVARMEDERHAWVDTKRELRSRLVDRLDAVLA